MIISNHNSFGIYIKPDPKALAFLSWGVPNSLNISSNGEPGGNSNGNGFVVVVIVCVVDMFTTEGINFSAKSAKELGISLLFPSILKKIKKIKNKY